MGEYQKKILKFLNYMYTNAKSLEEKNKIFTFLIDNNQDVYRKSIEM